ncbi:type IV secretion system protein VirB10 [Sphingobium xenophagum]|uniref:type IV secretion system protein VirB10 n=1 Tax=Sphingobium xenophagum TaxID=121428 RepID=UPI000362A9C8|nr:type IV secretion system protein VirB10 [Sphingobium xenophagum]
MSEDKRFDVDATPNMDEIDRAQPAADRPNRIPSLSNFQWDTKRMIVAGAVGGALLFTVLTVAAGVGGSDDAPVAPPRPAAVEVPYDPKTVIAPTLGTAPTDPNAPVQLTGEQVPPIGPGGAPGPATGQGAGREQTAAERRRDQAIALQDAARRSTLVAFGGDNNGVGMARPANADDAGKDGGSAAPAQASATRLDELKRTSAIGRATARMIGDRNYLITAGAIIPCTLQTAMDSSVPGYATCIIPRDVYSDNGRVVLMEKGTRVFGEYQGGLQRGQYRLFAMWTRAVTPRGVAIDIGSPASDQLGRSGITGKVNRFFWERFGTALLFSVLESAGQVGASAVGPEGTNITRVPSDSTSQILSDTQQIRPVVRVNQGAEMGITVAKDFDFSSVYGLGLK